MRFLTTTILLSFCGISHLHAQSAPTPPPQVVLETLERRDADARKDIEQLQDLIFRLRSQLFILKARFATPDDRQLHTLRVTISDETHFILGKRPVDKVALTSALREMAALFPPEAISITISGYESAPPQALVNVIKACFDAQLSNIEFTPKK